MISGSRATSLRRRLAITVGGGIAVVLIAAGATVVALVEHQLRRAFDTELLARARTLETLTELENGHVVLETREDLLPPLSRPTLFAVELADGTSLARSRALGNDRLVPAQEPRSGVRWHELELPDGRRARAVAIRFRPRVEETFHPGGRTQIAAAAPDGPMVTITVAAERETLEATIHRLRASALGLVLALLASTLAVVAAATSIGLRPLAALATEIERRGADTLADPIALPHRPPAELVPVVDRLDDLMRRLTATFERERAFTADAAHELRTPLAELRTLLEVALRHPGDRAALLDTLGEAHAVGRRLEHLVDQLLTLARTESASPPLRREPVALRAAVERAWQPLRGPASERRVALRLDIPDQLTVLCDPDLLAGLLDNLLANAISHGADDGWVEVRAAGREGKTSLTIANPAPALRPSDLPHLGERFWRRDPARTGGQHLGLGLALADAYASRLGITVERALENGVFHCRLGIPSAAPALSR